MSEVSYNPSLQTQRDKSISAHKCHTRNYTKETIQETIKKEEKKYYHKQAHVTTNNGNKWAGGKTQLLIQESKSHCSPCPRAYVSQIPNHKHLQQINGFAVLAGKKGVAKQEQQKHLDTGGPNTTQLLLLL